MAAETQYTANTGMATISVANTGLDGSGNIIYPTVSYNTWSVLTGASSGTLIKKVTVKAQGSPSQGMVRLWIYDGTNQRLFMEINVDPITQSTVDASFEKTVALNYKLKSGYQLLASTQNADTFNVIAEGLDFAYYTNLVRPESTQYTANTGLANISTGNSSMTGTGSTLLLTAASSGTSIDRIRIKAIAAISADMLIRVFIYDGTTYFVFKEVFVPAYSQSGTYQTFEHTIKFPDTLQLKSGYKIYVCGSVSGNFHITAEGMDWTYPSSTSTSNFTPASISNPGDTNEHIIHALQVPASIFTTGNLMEVHASLNVTNSANNKTWRIRINNANSLTGAVTIGTYIITNPVTDTISRYFPVISDTVVECYAGAANSQESQYGSNTNASANSAALTSLSAGFWVLITCQLATATETGTCRWSMVTKRF